MAGENVGRAYVEIRADGTKFEKDIKEILDRIHDTKVIQLKADIDLTKVKADLDSLKDQHPIKLTADIDLTKVRADLESLQKEHSIQLNADMDTSKARAEIDALKAEEDASAIHLRADADTSRANDAIRRLHDNSDHNPLTIRTAADTAVVTSELRSVMRSIENQAPAIRPTVDPTASANVGKSLRYLLKDQTFNIIPKIPDEVMAGLRGLGYSLIGAIPFKSYVGALSELAKDFENNAFKADMLATKIGSIGVAAGSAISDVLVLTSDLGKLMDFAAMGPAVFTAYEASMIVLKESFSNFSKALGGSKQALATFSKDVQDIILKLRDITKGFRQPIQDAFWDKVGNELIKLAKDDLPVVKDAFVETSKQLGGIFTTVLDGMDKWVKNGGFKTAFDNINQMWANAAKGAAPFTDALNKLTTVGSQYLPHLGDVIAKMATKFNDFVNASVDSGKFATWVNNATSTFRSLWGVLSDVYYSFGAISSAAREAGAGGLTSLEAVLDKLTVALWSEPFRSQFVFFLGQVRAGSKLLMQGFDSLAGSVSKFSGYLGTILQFGAGAGGLFLKDLGALFTAPRLGDGMLTALSGFQKALTNLQPAFKDIGNAIGDLGTIAGPMVQMTVDGLVHMIDTVSKVIANLRDGFAASLPVFNNFAQGLLGVASGPIIQIAKVVGDLLSDFAALPGPVQNIIMVMGVLGFALSKVLGGFNKFRDGMSNMWRGAQVDAGVYMGGLKDKLLGSIPGKQVTGAWQEFSQTVKISSGLIRDSFTHNVGDAATLARNNISTAFKGVGDSLRIAGSYAGDFGRKLLDGLNGVNKFKMPNLFGEMVPMVQKIPNLFQQAGASIKAAMIDDLVFHWKRGMGDMQEVTAKFKMSAAMRLSAEGALVKQGFSDIVSSAKTHLSMLPILAQQAGTGVSSGFKGMAESAKLHMTMLGIAAKNAGDSMATAMRPGTNAIRGFFEDIPNWMTKAGIDVYGAADKIKSGMTAISDKASVTAKTIGTGVGSAVTGLGTKISNVFSAASNSVTAFGRGVQEKVGGAIDGTKTRLQTMGTSISNFFAPLATAGKGMFSGVGTALAETGKGIAGVAGAVKTAAGETVRGMGLMAGAGLKAAGKMGLGALGGIMDLMGGPWGVALALATTGITLWAQGQAEAKQRVDALTQSIDAQTGAFNDNGLKQIAQQWTDIGKSGDGMANLTRGAKAANETAQALGMSLSDITKGIASGGPAYDSMINNLQKIAQYKKDYETATGPDGGGAGALMGLEDERKAAEDATGALGLNKDAVDKLNASDLTHYVDNIMQGRKEAELAQTTFKQMGDATGSTSIAAQQMAAAMKTIGDNSMDASGKIAAINKSLELLKNGGKLDVQAAESNTRTAMDSAVQQATALKEQITGLKGNYDSLLDADHKLKTGTSTTANELYKSMTSATDAIKIQAQAAFDAAKASGQTSEQAADAASKVIDGSDAKLKEIADAAGIPVEKLRDQWKSFFGDKWQLTATFSANAQNVQAALEASKKAGFEWDGTRWTAFLLANPDEAKKSVDQQVADARKYADDQYVAALKALPDDAEASLATLIGKTNTDWKGADWTAVMTVAKDIPGLEGVVNQLDAAQYMNGADRQAAIAAIAKDIAAVESQLDALAATRTATIIAHVSSDGSSMPVNGSYGMNRNGSVLSGSGSGMFGLGSEIKAFANGGIENHIAQIAMPGAMPRVWAEAETGGEAYIPLGLDKRARSLKILEQVAEIFGLGLMKKMAFADGGILRSMPSASAIDAYRSSQSQGSQRPMPVAAPVGPGINLNVYPSQGLSEQQIGESAAKTLYWNMMTMPR